VTQARRSFERPDPELVAALGRYATAELSDAMARAGTMDPRLHAVGTAVRMAGPALTVRVYPNDNFMCHVAVTLAEPGDILVIDGGGYVGAALWGELLTRAALARGVAGVILDAAARDRQAITDLGLPVFAAAVVPRGTHKRHAGDANVPVTCGGLAISPGDIVVTDADGIAVVPRLRAYQVLERVRAVEEREQQLLAGLAAGQPLSQLMKLDALLADSGIDWDEG
jgi:4-hydroxy-4-methyl-2-oxoglutarate aldolase